MNRPALKARADLLSKLRNFFSQRDVLEVDVPLLGATAVTDPHISSIEARSKDQTYFLQTSPEFFMKRMLAAGSGSIFYLGKTVRDDPQSARHNPEFTMLEWYREGFNDLQLMDEVEQLLKAIVVDLEVERVSYGALFEKHFAINPHQISNEDLAANAKRHVDVSWDKESNSTWCDLLFSHLIEPELQKPTIVHDYPEFMCALARVEINAEGENVAKRFELFWKGLELANGYWELTDAKIQRQRFEKDLKHRDALGLVKPAIDEKFLQAMESGLPRCAGIALGVERLLMCVENLVSIDQAMAYSTERL